MVKHLVFEDLRNFLEESLREKKGELIFLNKYCKDEKSFLSCTYKFIQILQTDNLVKYLVVIFKDLPHPYPDLILENIKTYIRHNDGVECEYQTWETYENYHRDHLYVY